jgi:hypothetical protein
MADYCPRCGAPKTKKYNYECGTYWSGDGHTLRQSQYCQIAVLTKERDKARLEVVCADAKVLDAREAARWLAAFVKHQSPDLQYPQALSRWPWLANEKGDTQ